MRKIRNDLRKSPAILPCMTFISELSYRAPPNDHRVLSLRTLRILSFMTKRNTHFRVIFIDIEAGDYDIYELGNALGPHLLRLENALQYSLNIAVHTFIHSSTFLVILTNCPFSLTYSCVPCGSMSITISLSKVNECFLFRLKFRRDGSLQT